MILAKLTDFSGNFVDIDGENSAMSNLMNLQLFSFPIVRNYSITFYYTDGYLDYC